MILGLHHVTATVDTAQADLDFYRDTLGLRLVKKTVNFDNHNVYHFYYGDETGTPGTIWTTFPYAGWGVPVGVKGAGQIGVTSFSVPAGSLPAWIDRLRARGIDAADDQPRFGEESITFADPSGLLIELVATPRDPRQPWTGGGVDAAQAIRGLHSVTMVVRTFDRTVEFMTTHLGYRVSHEMDGRLRLTVNGDAPGKTIDIVANERGAPAKNGLGTVHHVAMAVADADEQLRFRQKLLELGVSVTPVMDRQYFQSIYFREPGGVLFEIATLEPGFLFDESRADLGRNLKLPPWEEKDRRSIEAGLPEIDSSATGDRSAAGDGSASVRRD
jgi:glyoxalase family protein